MLQAETFAYLAAPKFADFPAFFGVVQQLHDTGCHDGRVGFAYHKGVAQLLYAFGSFGGSHDAAAAGQRLKYFVLNSRAAEHWCYDKRAVPVKGRERFYKARHAHTSEGGEFPYYNSVDAPLLFVNSVYEYVTISKDTAFQEEMIPVLEQIIDAYQNGTDYHIKMDEDSLIMAGAGFEQLTWMDVRVGDFLPTPRHGKPVEINAYWYNALMVMYTLTQKTAYKELAETVKVSFCEKFWNENEQCLKDVLSGGKDENQIRCNQIWALTMPFTMLPDEREARVIKKVKEELYTTVGLRTLSRNDPDFHEIYIGKVEERDRAYHQGTVWAFPLGAYYRACIRYAQKCSDAAATERIKNELQEGFDALKTWLDEGCVSQIAEIYDGGTPTISRGCFAQAWSVAELLRAVYDYERM